jgi:hypothetical protein
MESGRAVDAAAGAIRSKRARKRGQTGQQYAQPKFAAHDNPELEIHAGSYPLKVYRSLSRKQQEAIEALRKEKKKNKKDGSSIGAVVVAKSPVAAEPSNGVATASKEGESPDESHAARCG